MKESYTSSSRRQVETSLTEEHMTARRLVRRRAAIKEMGQAGLAVVLFGIAACSDTRGQHDFHSALARQSVVKLAGFDYEVALFGHGEPLLEGASTAVGALASG
jgi:hypothetical protein